MRIIFATLIAFILVGCGSIPGLQTVGIDSDPDKLTKQVIVATTLTVDAVGVYGALPPCDGTNQPLGCRKEKAYQDAKLIMQSTAAGFQGLRSGSQSSILLSAALVYAQYELAKTIAVTPAPTDPNAPPPPASVAYIHAIGLADILVNTADQRIQDAASVNVTVAELLDQLQAKVAALP